MKLSRRVEIDMAIQAAHPQAGLDGFPVMSRVEFLLRKLRHEHAQSVQLRRCDQSPEQPVEVLGVEHLTLRDIAEFGMGREENRRGKFRQQTLRQIKVYVEPFESLKFLDLHLREYLTAHSLLDVREPIED